MICTKCNNEIPEGAKFCPSCGAVAAAPEIEKKLYCEKCGLELMKGAKFCSVCGGNGAARENRSAEVMAAVDLGKPSESDSLVSAMNSSANSAPAANGVPMPSNNIPMPVNGSSSDAASSSGSYSSAQPVIPPYVASVSADAGQAPVMPMPTASSEAVAAVKKKGNGGKIVLFSILGVLLVAVAATLVMFFTNRAAFLSTLMGKEKYATMVEGNSIKDVTDKLDIPAISNGIKTASGTVQSLYAAYGAEMLDGMSARSGAINKAPMSYTSASDGSFTGGGFDLESFTKEFAALLSDTYGVNSINETLSVNVELGDSVKSMIESNMYYDIDLDEILELVNGTSFNYTLTAKDDKAAVTMGTQGKIVVNAKLMLDGQDAYIALPFASDKAIKISVPKGEEQIDLNAKPLELDEKEIERLITECVEIYLGYYKDSAIEMENGEIKAGGVTVEGKVITAEFKGKQLSKMFTDIAKHIVKDDYLMTAITDYANSLGADITKQELVDEALEELEDTMDADDSDKLVITTVIDRNGDVLGKSFKAIDEDGVLCEIAYAETNDQIGFEFNGSDYSSEISNLQIKVDKKDDENGTCKVKFTVDEQEFSIVINYSDCKTAKFCGNEIPTGKISIGMALPEEFSDQLGKENFAAINGASLNFGITADSANTISYSIGVNVPNYGSITVKDVVTAMNDDSDLKTPSNVIDVTGALTGNVLPGDNTWNELTAFAGEITEALKKALPESIVSDLDDYFPYSGIIGDNVYTFDDEDIDYLLDDIMDDMTQISSILNGSSLDPDKKSKLNALFSDYMSLYTEVSAKASNMTAAEFEKFDDRYYDLYDRLFDLDVMPSYPVGGGTNALADRVEAKMENISEKLAEIYIKYYTASVNSKTQSAFDEIMKASEELGNYCMETGADDFSSCTEAQIKHIDSLLDILDSKIAAFEAQ